MRPTNGEIRRTFASAQATAGTPQNIELMMNKEVQIAIGQNGMGSVYASPQAAQATWQAMDAYRAKGGQAVMTLPLGALKCAGAPLKMTFMLRDRLHKAGTLEKSRITFHSSPANIFSVKPASLPRNL